MSTETPTLDLTGASHGELAKAADLGTRVVRLRRRVTRLSLVAILVAVATFAFAGWQIRRASGALATRTRAMADAQRVVQRLWGAHFGSIDGKRVIVFPAGTELRLGRCYRRNPCVVIGQ